jgi:TonB family protein
MLPTPTSLAGPQERPVTGMEGRFGLALLISAGLHVAVLASWAAPGTGPQSGSESAQVVADAPLQVAVARSRTTPPAPANIVPPVKTASFERTTAGAGESKPTVQPQPARAAPAGGGLVPNADVTDNVPRARLGDYIEAYMVRNFPVEIEEPARIGTPLSVEFPSAALRDRREGTVVLWVVVRADGTVDEIHNVTGTPEFLDAVTAVVARARFRPATSGGQAIRFPISLEFTFRIAPSDPDGAAAGITAAR